MNDLVERLRNTNVIDDPARLKAADEIERRQVCCHTQPCAYMKAIDEQRTEIKQLRSAIKAIAEWSDEENEWDGRDKFHTIREMARRLHQQKTPWASATTPS